MHACAEILELQHISGLKYVIFIQFIYIYIIFVEKSTEIFEGFRALVLLNHKFTEHVHCKLHSLIPRVSIKGDFIGKVYFGSALYSLNLQTKCSLCETKHKMSYNFLFYYKSHGVKLDV